MEDAVKLGTVYLPFLFKLELADFVVELSIV